MGLYMTRHFAYVAAILFALVSAAPAQGPDEKYVHIYNSIQEADGLLARGQAIDAAAKYKEAQTALKQLQEGHPGWSPKIVDYRLNYISGKLAPLEAKLAGTTPPAGTNATMAAGTTAQPMAGDKSMHEQIAMLTQQNAKLQAQLKEAWSVQPAAADPQELAKSQQALMEIQKERDLLKASLEDAKSKKPEEMGSALEQERKILTEVRQQLAQQTELVGTLQKENELLKGQMSSLKSVPNADLAGDLQVAHATIAALQATNIALLTETFLLQGQLADAGKAMAPVNMKELERERDDLRKRLETAQRQLSRRKGDRGEETQLQSALARLEVYEAKPVPYTAEELALFKQPDLKVTISDAAVTARKKPRELPPGAGPLMAEAQRAMEAGRFGDAEKKFKEVLRQDENNVVVLGHLASVQMDQNQLSDAERTLTKALAADSEDAASLYLMGRLRLLQEKYDEALDALSLSAKVVPDDPRTQYWLGKVLVQKGQRVAAETAFRRAVQLRPGWGEAHYSLAMVYAAQQPPYKELAQWHYQKAITGGYPRNVDFEKLIEEKRASSQ